MKHIYIILLIITNLAYSQTKIPKRSIPTIEEDMLSESVITKLNSAGMEGQDTIDSNIYYYVNELSDLQGDLTAVSNKKIIILESIDLQGTTVALPNFSTLLFEGGSIHNGTLSGNFHIYHKSFAQIFGLDVSFTGTITHSGVYMEWFGGGVNVAENINYLRKVNEFLVASNGGEFRIKGIGQYLFSNEAPDGVWNQLGEGGNREAVVRWTANNSTIIIEPQSTLKVHGSFPTTSSNTCRFFTFQSCKNVHISGGGSVIGNRDERGDNDFDFAFNIYASTEDVSIRNLKISGFPADGIKPQIATNFQGGTTQVWEIGGYNDVTGVAEANTNKIRSTINYPLTRSKNIELGYFVATDTNAFLQEQAPDGFFNVYFFDAQDTFVDAFLSQQMYEKIIFPPNATYAKVSLDTNDLSREWRFDIRALEIPSNIKIENNTISDMGRQGISATGWQDVFITNNIIHDIFGNPGAAIDFEDGRYINRRIHYLNNTSYNVDRHVICYNPKDIFIRGNSFLRNRDDRGVVNGVFIAEVGGRISVTDNYFEYTRNQCVSGAEFKNNFFDKSEILMSGGEISDSYVRNSILRLIGTVNFNSSDMYVSNLVFDNNTQKASTLYNNSITSSSFSDNSKNVLLKNITITGQDNSDSVKLEEGITVDGLTLINVSNTRIETTDITNVTTDSNLFFWGTPYENQKVFLKNFKLTNGSFARFRSTTNSTNGYILEDWLITGDSEKVIEFDNTLGTVELNNFRVDLLTTGTSWSVIDFNSTVNAFKVRNSSFSTTTAGNLVDIGSSINTGFVYRDNILDNVVLNSRLTDINRNNIINGREKSVYPSYADNTAALVDLEVGEYYIHATKGLTIVE